MTEGEKKKENAKIVNQYPMREDDFVSFRSIDARVADGEDIAPVEVRNFSVSIDTSS